MILIPLLSVLIQTLGGAKVDALRADDAKAIVYIFTSTDCPVSNRYAPEVRRLAERFSSEAVRFRLIYPSRRDADAMIRAHVAAFSYPGVTEALRDPDLALVRFTGATITPEAVVIADGQVRYRGRIDDRYVELGVDRQQATTHDLGDAIDAVLGGRPVAEPVTRAVGCYIADLAR